MRILAIDQGTSGTKALVQQDGATLAVVTEPVQVQYGEGGAVEVDPQHLLDSVLNSGRRALAAAGGAPPDAVALANQGETVLAWDRATGTPAGPAIVWQDSRAQSVCDRLAANADLVHERSGLMLDPYFSAPKMAWLRERVGSGPVITTTDTWLVHALTGEFVTDVTTAGRSALLNLDTLTWDDELLSVFGLADEQLPQIVGNDVAVGSTAVFGGQASLAALMVDQQAALVAQRCLSAGSAKCTYGTGAFLLANAGDKAVRSDAGLTTSPAYVTTHGRAYCLDGQVFTAGSALSWMVSAGLLSSPQALDAECGPASGSTVFVPGLAGLGAPYWSSTPSGAFLGMTLASDRGTLVRAVVEGIAAQICDLAEAASPQSPAGSLRVLTVDGGLTASSVLMQAQADLLQVPVEVYPSPDATALGMAALARAGVQGLDLERAVDDWRAVRTYEPQWSADRAGAVRQAWREGVRTVLSGGGAK